MGYDTNNRRWFTGRRLTVIVVGGVIVGLLYFGFLSERSPVDEMRNRITFKRLLDGREPHKFLLADVRLPGIIPIYAGHIHYGAVVQEFTPEIAEMDGWVKNPIDSTARTTLPGFLMNSCEHYYTKNRNGDNIYLLISPLSSDNSIVFVSGPVKYYPTLLDWMT